MVLSLIFLHILHSNAVASSITNAGNIFEVSRKCTCKDVRLCEPISIQHDKEFFGFQYPFTQNFREYNWTLLTTVAWQDDPELVCTAHAHGVRVVANAGDLTEALQGAAQRMQWVVQTVQHVLSRSLDGVNFDLEEAAEPGSDIAHAYTELVALTAEVLHDLNPSYQVSVDVPWTPYDSDGRNYDWAALARHADLLVVMAYDMQSQVWGSCVASANDPLSLVRNGLRQWLHLVPASALVLGVPWYGYDYECANHAAIVPGPPEDGPGAGLGTQGGARASGKLDEVIGTCRGGTDSGSGDGSPGSMWGDVCVLQPADFRGAPCSDLVGAQRPIAELLPVMHGEAASSVKWDALQQAPFFNYNKEGTVHQVWFSNPRSLSLRYKLAAQLGLKGVAAWNLEHLYSGSEAGVTAATAGRPSTGQELLMRTEMWQAVEAFFSNNSL